MIKRLIQILTASVLLLYLSGCSTLGRIPANAHPEAMNCDVSTFHGYANAKSDHVIYFQIHPGTQDGLLAYYDTTSETGGLLCGKAECTHRDENCNASLPYWTEAFACHDGYLWFDLPIMDGTDEHAVFMCDADGRNRRKIRVEEGFTPEFQLVKVTDRSQNEHQCVQKE